MTRKPRSHVRIFYISNVGYFLLPPRLVSPRARKIFTHARLYRSRNYSRGKLHKQKQVVDFWTKGAFICLINLCLHRISLLLSLKWVVQQQILKFYMFKISELQPGVCHHFHKFPNRPFPHSSEQRHQLEARVDKIQWFVWNCPPEPRPHFFVFVHWSVMRERSIDSKRLKNYYIYPMEKRTISLNITLLINITLW